MKSVRNNSQYGKWYVNFSKKLGKGGQGKVFIANSEEDDKNYAIKIISIFKMRTDKKRKWENHKIKRYENEVKILKSFSENKFVIPIIDNGYKKINKKKTDYFHITELADMDLNEKIRYKPRITEKAKFRIFDQILEAIKFIHSHGILHRDLKPSNIYLDKFNRIKIGDFGLGFKFNQERITLPLERLGSRYFMAPELIKPKDIVDKKSDFYSLGKILYFLLSDGEIFDGEGYANAVNNLVQIKNDSRYYDINNIIFSKSIVADKNLRFSNIEEFKRSYEQGKSLFLDPKSVLATDADAFTEQHRIHPKAYNYSDYKELISNIFNDTCRKIKKKDFNKEKLEETFWNIVIGLDYTEDDIYLRLIKYCAHIINIQINVLKGRTQQSVMELEKSWIEYLHKILRESYKKFSKKTFSLIYEDYPFDKVLINLLLEFGIVDLIDLNSTIRYNYHIAIVWKSFVENFKFTFIRFSHKCMLFGIEFAKIMGENNLNSLTKIFHLYKPPKSRTPNPEIFQFLKMLEHINQAICLEQKEFLNQDKIKIWCKDWEKEFTRRDLSTLHLSILQLEFGLEKIALFYSNEDII